MWIFSTRGGVNPKSTLLKKCGFSRGGGGSWVQFPHFFVPFYFFKKNFVLFHPVFVGRKVIFRGKLEKIFPPQNVFPYFRGGPGGVEKIHIFFFFEGFSDRREIEQSCSFSLFSSSLCSSATHHQRQLNR